MPAFVPNYEWSILLSTHKKRQSMVNFLVTNSLIETTIISFLQNRLRELGITDDTIEASLCDVSGSIVKIIKAHIKYKDHLSSEEDLYYDEVTHECYMFLTQIQSAGLNGEQLKKLLFIVSKLFDRIAIEAKEGHNLTLATIAFETERKILNLIINHREL